MSSIERFLGREAEQVSHADLMRFLGERLEEGLYLDYKAMPPSGQPDFDKLSNLIGGFANSAGGLLLLGVGEDQSAPNRIHPGPITWAPPELTRERVEHGLLVRLSPPIRFMRIVPVRDPSGPGSVYLIDVPQSEEPPHMSLPAHRYYKRLNFQTVPMEHYEVADLFGRRRKPSLHLGYRIRAVRTEAAERCFRFEVFVCNMGPAPAKNVQLAIIFSSSVTIRNQYGLRLADDVHSGLPALEAEVLAPRIVHRKQALRVGWSDLSVRGDQFPVELKYSLLAEETDEKLGRLLVRLEDLAAIEDQLKMDAPPGTPTEVSIRTM